MLLIYTFLITASLFHLGSRATITQPIWSRYPWWLARFMDCAACTGFWYGLAMSTIFVGVFEYDYPVLGHDWWAASIIGVCSIAATPMVAALQQMGLDRLGSAVAPPEET